MSCPGPEHQGLKAGMGVLNEAHGRWVSEAHVGAEAGPEPGSGGLEKRLQNGCEGWWRGTKSLPLDPI